MLARALALAAGLVLLALPFRAMAQSPSDALAEARAAHAAGREAFDAGRFAEARERFAHAYRLSLRPELLYNLAQACDRLHDDEAALEAFEQYLRAAPDAPNRAEVEGRIAALREARARTAAAPAPLAPEPPRPPPRGPDGGPLIAVGIVLALAGGGGIALGAVAALDLGPRSEASSIAEAALATCTGTACTTLGIAAEEARAAVTESTILSALGLGAGGALLVAGAILLGAGAGMGGGGSAAACGPAAGPELTGLSCAGSF